MSTLVNPISDASWGPNCLKHFHIWQEWRGQQLIPTKMQSLPEMMGPELSGLSVLEVERPDEIIIRIYAGVLEDLVSLNRKGENFIDLATPQSRAARIKHLENVIKQPCGMFGVTQIYSELRQPKILSTLVLPVAKSKSMAPTLLYAASDAVDIRSKTEQVDLPPSPIVSQMDYIDIGRGVPL